MKEERSRSIPPEVQATLEATAPEARQRLEKMWHLLTPREIPAGSVPDDEAAWADLQARLDAAGAGTPDAPTSDPRRRAAGRPPVRRRRPHPHRHLLPVSVLLVLALGLGLWWWHRPVTVTVPPGRQLTVTLPDGSTVHLNSDTRLSYARGFRTWPLVDTPQRRVRLDGEAFFDVKPGRRTFVVETFNARVEVLGTRFNVWARAEAPARETRVTLAEGHVRVLDAGAPEQAVELRETGHAARVTDAAPSPLPQRAGPDALEAATAWRRQGFTAVNQPLSAILAELQRRYARDLGAEPGIALTDSLTLLYLRPVPLEAILKDLCLVQGCRYRPTSRGFVLIPGTPAASSPSP
ncbi:FecR domain-containing protein [Rhodocaloribacter litoris]|uniref:FecR family protein n=1 Tax=Rhodocaloribacter litoris TaxID=2558931 RepID=UPI001423B96D|nr:FecR domain-containing protein [Rhodocaloribacter litoris]QXD16656.1 FecR domain-containing protein [Rhodocaloribacter litoris]